MGEIVSFGKAERLVWVCGECGCSTFYLYNDTTSECAGCGRVSDGGEWVTPLQDKKQSPEKNNGGCVDVISIGSVDFARRRVLKKIADNPEEIALVARWTEDGDMTSWSAAETPEQRDWAARKLRELAASFEARPDSRYANESE